MELNKQYILGAAIGGFIGFFASTQAFMHPRQAIWLIAFGGAGGYAIAESRELRKRLESGEKGNPDELSQAIAELRSLAAQAKSEKSSD